MSNSLQSEKLKDFLCKEVQNLCDADPELVAQYIMALIGTGEPVDSLKSSLEEKLDEFFGDQTSPFIERLFKELGYGQESRSKTESSEFEQQSSSRHRLSDNSEDEDDGDRNFKHRRQRSGSREDARHSRHSDDRHYKRRLPETSHSYGSNKQPRGDDYYRGGGSHSASSGVTPAYQSGQQAYDNRGRMGRGYRGDTGNSGRRRPLCRDYNEKGFCMRGDMCPYDHGADRIVVDDGSFSSPFPNMAPGMATAMGQAAQPPFYNMPSNFDAYDPERAALVPNSGTMGNFPPVDMTGVPGAADTMMSNRGFGGMRNNMRGRGRGGRGRNGGMMGGHQNRQNTTLVVENIPVEHCEIAKVNEYFKKFGSLTNISVQSHLNRAVLQFSTHAEASAAYNCPEPIFDNRFVKVYWHKESDENKSVPAPDAARPKSEIPAKRNEPDPEEVAARAAELAKEREEKRKKYQERMKTILELQKQKEQLLQRQIEEQKRLMDQLTTNKNLSQAEKEQLLKSLKQIAADIDSSKKAATLTTAESAAAASDATAATSDATGETGTKETSEDLKIKLAKLESEAASLGITTFSARGGRGGYYGRGRGWPRARGGFQRYTLDNRPTKILIQNAPEEAKEDLQKHFEQFGNVTSFETVDSGIVVQYAQRFEAEKAMATGSNTPKGSLQLSWFAASQTPSHSINAEKAESTPVQVTASVGETGV